MSDSESSEAVKAAQEPEVLGSGETEEPLSASNAPSDGAADASAEGGDGTSEAVSAQAGDAPADGSDASSDAAGDVKANAGQEAGEAHEDVQAHGGADAADAADRDAEMPAGSDGDKPAADGALFETESGQTVQSPSQTGIPHVRNGASRSSRMSRDIRRQQAEMKRYVYPIEELKKHLRIDIGMMIGAPVVLCVMLGVCISLGGLAGVLIFLAVAAVMGLVFHNRLMHFRKSVKYSMVFNAIDKTFSPEVYLAYKDVDEDVLEAAGIVEDWHEGRMSDYFRGSWRNFPFSFGDVHITGREVNKKLAQTIYSGQLFVIETGLDLKSWITIRERKTMLTPELYEAQKSSDKFFMTGNAQFDRQFEVRFGMSGKASSDSDAQAAARATALHLVECLAQDMIAADAYVVSRTTMRFEGNFLYLATENARDTFELQRGDLKNLELLGRRFSEEVEAMTIYLDLVTKGLEAVKSRAE